MPKKSEKKIDGWVIACEWPNVYVAFGFEEEDALLAALDPSRDVYFENDERVDDLRQALRRQNPTWKIRPVQLVFLDEVENDT